MWQTKAICTWIFCDKKATDVFAEDSDNIMRAITIKKFVSAQTAGSKASIVLQLLNSDNRHQLTVSACGASNCQVLSHPPPAKRPRRARRRSCEIAA